MDIKHKTERDCRDKHFATNHNGQQLFLSLMLSLPLNYYLNSRIQYILQAQECFLLSCSLLNE